MRLLGGRYMNKILKKSISIIIVIALLIGIGVFTYDYFKEYTYLFKNPEQIKELLLSYGSYSFLAFIVIQVLQILIFFIPGEVVQIAGGYVFGPLFGFLLSVIGIVIGSAFTFQISRVLGKPFVNKICNKSNSWIIKKIEKNSHNDKGVARIVFIFYLIPGIPKDLLGYICGISDLSLKQFLILSTVGRAPALLFSCFFGHSIGLDSVLTLVVLTISFLIIFILALIFSKKYIGKIKEE